MNILSVVSEFRRNQIFTKEDYSVLESLGNVYYLTDEQIKNIDSNETRSVLEEILPKVDACFSYVDHIPEDLITKYKNVKIVAEIAGALPKGSWMSKERISCGSRIFLEPCGSSDIKIHRVLRTVHGVVHQNLGNEQPLATCSHQSGYF